jgi:23S rRNA (uracil1939-C5)-methyltransferase
MSRRNRKPLPAEPLRAAIDSLAHDGRGVAHINGKATFIEAALPGEEVLFVYRMQRKRYDEGEAVEIITPSPERVTPRCPHFSVCGGCSLQHVAPAAQIRMKEEVLLESLRRIGDVVPAEIMPPLDGPHWAYRRRARLGAKYVDKKQAMLVGFREPRSSYLADLSRCEILHPAVGGHLLELRELLGGLHAYRRIPQIEVAASDDAVALVFRHLEPLPEADRIALRDFGERRGFYIYLQAGGPDSIVALWPEDPHLTYSLPAFDLALEFSPSDFTQVNGVMNRRMVEQAVALLAPGPEERVLDLFCGLGNFTLPIARSAGSTLGVEGDAKLVQRACDNAARNGIVNAEFLSADLATPDAPWPWLEGGFDKVLLDPPRTGALDAVRRIGGLRAVRIVYVSCNPATFARDAAELVHAHGYRLLRAGVMDMFPHTTHVECMALFER